MPLEEDRPKDPGPVLHPGRPPFSEGQAIGEEARPSERAGLPKRPRAGLQFGRPDRTSSR